MANGKVTALVKEYNATRNERLSLDQASAKLMRSPHGVAERRGDEHHQRHGRQEVGLDVIVVVAHRRIDINDSGTSADVCRNTAVQYAEERWEAPYREY